MDPRRRSPPRRRTEKAAAKLVAAAGRNVQRRPQPPSWPPPRPRPAPPPGPPPRREVPKPGIWFGHNFRLAIEGRDVAGRWIAAKNALWEHAYDEPLPKVFQRGGDESKIAHRGGNARAHAVMGLVTLHNMEFRKWSMDWGPLPAVGGRMAPSFAGQGWRKYDGSLPRPQEDPWFFHPQLQTRVGLSAPNPKSSTLLRAGTCHRTGYESRDVAIVSLPELFLEYMYTRYAEEIYEEWLEAEVIIAVKPPRGTVHGHRWRW